MKKVAVIIFIIIIGNLVYFPSAAVESEYSRGLIDGDLQHNYDDLYDEGFVLGFADSFDETCEHFPKFYDKCFLMSKYEFSPHEYERSARQKLEFHLKELVGAANNRTDYENGFAFGYRNYSKKDNLSSEKCNSSYLEGYHDGSNSFQSFLKAYRTKHPVRSVLYLLDQPLLSIRWRFLDVLYSFYSLVLLSILFRIIFTSHKGGKFHFRSGSERIIDSHYWIIITGFVIVTILMFLLILLFHFAQIDYSGFSSYLPWLLAPVFTAFLTFPIAFLAFCVAQIYFAVIIWMPISSLVDFIKKRRKEKMKGSV